MKIIVGGDTHGDRNHVRWLLNKAASQEAAGVFVLGDFGVWDHYDRGAFTAGVAGDAARLGLTLWFLPGNHENYDILDRIEAEHPRTKDGFVEYTPGDSSLLYSPRGHRWTWGGIDFLSLGGAYSVDKDWRVDEDLADAAEAMAAIKRGHGANAKERYALQRGHARWWPQEEITEAQADAAASGAPVDILLAHDKPINAQPHWNRKDIAACEHNQRRLQRVVDALTPQLYLHGHLHYAYRDVLEKTGTTVQAFDCNPDAQDVTRPGSPAGPRQTWGLLILEQPDFGITWQEADGTLDSELWTKRDKEES